MTQQTENTRVPVKVTVGAVKIHGPNSDKPEGTRERIQTEGPISAEVDYEMAVNLFGKDKADELFAEIPEEDR